jgi:aquaporin related protein
MAVCLVGAVPWMRGLLLTIAQFLGVIIAAAAVKAAFPGDLKVQTALSSSTTVVQGFLIEMLLTFQLVITLFMLAVEKHAATFIAPVSLLSTLLFLKLEMVQQVGIGLSLFISELSDVHFTGGSLNPARSVAPDLVLANFAPHHWVYWAGPYAGAVLAAGLYKLLKSLDFEMANPGQDASTADEADNQEGGVRI